MKPAHLAMSRVIKALADGSEVHFGEAEQRLRSTCVAVLVQGADLSSPAAQACALTALNAALRTFGSAALITRTDIPLRRPAPSAPTLVQAARRLGAEVFTSVPQSVTHLICIGPVDSVEVPFTVCCWWDGWNAGVVAPWDTSPVGATWNPLAGVFAGALAVREVFANVRGLRPCARASRLSLWDPGRDSDQAEVGPAIAYMVRELVLVGLGHLGQGVLWSLAALPAAGRIVLQDYQDAGEENVATGLITRQADVGNRKARIAAQWIEIYGWSTSLVERRIGADAAACDSDPGVIVTALDSVAPRRHALAAGHVYMLDAGVGHGPVDFEICQLRSFARDDPASWEPGSEGRDSAKLMQRGAYMSMAKKDACGALQLASASVAVPFVGAAVGAMVVAQLLRLGAMESPIRLMQVELASPDLATRGSSTRAPTSNLGTIEIDLVSGAAML